MTLTRLLLVISFFSSLFTSVFSQDSIVVLKPKKSKKSKIQLVEYDVTSSVRSENNSNDRRKVVNYTPSQVKEYTTKLSVPKKAYQKNELPEIDNVSMATNFQDGLQDHPEMAKIDQKWKQELTQGTLYNILQETRLNQNYTNVEFVEDLPTELLKDRLSSLNAKTPFNVEYNPQLESVIKNYLKNRKTTMSRLLALSQYYFPMFEEVLDKYDMPLEIKYLAIVESALKPRAKSRVGATGLWQFMYGTAKMYQLDVNSYVDERMDPLKATDAAARYLSKLYETFNDWDLALAAYNSGPGNVTKAIRRSGGYKNYWNIRPFLPRETAGYLPAFLATMYIFEYAAEHNINFQRPQFRYYETDTIVVKKQITLKQVADNLKVPEEDLQFLNPEYKLNIIPVVEGKDYNLRLPTEKIGVFVSHESAIYDKATTELEQREKPLPELVKLNSKIRYKIRNGDNLGAIAERFGVRVSQIKQWNGLRSNNIRAGKYLTIYPRKVNSYLKSKSNVKPVAVTSSTYRVKSGDSLWSIANKYLGLTIDKLKQLNNLTSSSLKPGMVLRLK